MVRNQFAAGAGPVLGMRRRGLRLEVGPSLCVFRKIWAAEGRAFEMVDRDVDPGKRFFINELVADL